MLFSLPLRGYFLLDLLLYLLASLLDETLPVRQVLLNQGLIIVFGRHVFLDVTVIQILPSSHHRRVCFILQCLQLSLLALELSPFSSVSTLHFLQSLFLFLAFSLSTIGVRIDEI